MVRVKSIRFLMITYFTTITTVIMLFTGIVLYQKSNDILLEYAEQTGEQMVTQVKYSMDNYTKNMLDISNTLYYKMIKNKNIVEHDFIPELNIIKNTNEQIVSLAIFREDGALVAASDYEQVQEGIVVKEEEWFQKAVAEPENVHFSAPHQQTIFGKERGNVISLSRAVSLNQNGAIRQGVLLVDMNLTGIEDIFTLVNESDTGSVYMLSPDESVVFGTDELTEGRRKLLTTTTPEQQVVKFDGERILMTQKTVSYTGWKIVGLWDVDKILVSYIDVGTFLGVLVGIGLGCCVVGSLILCTRLLSPLYRLEKSMKLVERGNFDIEIEETEGEYIVSELSKTFNKMLGRIRQLRNDIVIEQDSKRKKEMEALQAQINPHFLYNTLDSIIWQIEDERFEEATEMISALSRFFRIGISSGRTIITVKEEIEHAKNYLAIQKIRYKNKFDYEIEMDEEVESAKTVKLLLQPIIENALYHGIQYSQEKGRIFISAQKVEDTLVYRIEDNGVGMDSETCQRLFTEEVKKHTKGSGVGVNNVYNRVILYYGEAYGVEVQSELEEGTVVEILIPLEYE